MRMIQFHTRGLWILSAGWNHQYAISAAMPRTTSMTMSAVRLHVARRSMNGGTGISMCDPLALFLRAAFLRSRADLGSTCPRPAPFFPPLPEASAPSGEASSTSTSTSMGSSPLGTSTPARLSMSRISSWFIGKSILPHTDNGTDDTQFTEAPTRPKPPRAMPAARRAARQPGRGSIHLPMFP